MENQCKHFLIIPERRNRFLPFVVGMEKELDKSSQLAFPFLHNIPQLCCYPPHHLWPFPMRGPYTFLFTWLSVFLWFGDLLGPPPLWGASFAICPVPTYSVITRYIQSLTSKIFKNLIIQLLLLTAITTELGAYSIFCLINAVLNQDWINVKMMLHAESQYWLSLLSSFTKKTSSLPSCWI